MTDPTASNDDQRGLVRPARRPDGWRAPGPPPAEPHDVGPRAGEDLCYLLGDWRILQRLDGHRWSLDDLVTAWTAATCRDTSPSTVLDLGCGIGSVLLMTAWHFPEARLVGVEAQPVSLDLARRSATYNGVAGRVRVLPGDLRDLDRPERFDLVTGTPPYFPPGTGTESDHVQCGPCRFEHRGGVEDYCDAAARHLAPGGVAVLCHAASQSARVVQAARDAGLALSATRNVHGKVGKPPLVAVFELVHPERAPTEPLRRVPLAVRDRDGQWTAGFRTLRRDMGMPDRPPGR